eukprot:TRINITY_DN5465_c0_g1_i1.p1 TRINITY_DN5465_c0_g1~~TRINITY_DN5465_c0_g1_i1.p1  ORF type:complete len:402 (+),score=15.04 TRINITY_DN5465_c0_g1_i1:389-1594(+)
MDNNNNNNIEWEKISDEAIQYLYGEFFTLDEDEELKKKHRKKKGGNVEDADKSFDDYVEGGKSKPIRTILIEFLKTKPIDEILQLKATFDHLKMISSDEDLEDISIDSKSPRPTPKPTPPRSTTRSNSTGRAEDINTQSGFVYCFRIPFTITTGDIRQVILKVGKSGENQTDEAARWKRTMKWMNEQATAWATLLGKKSLDVPHPGKGNRTPSILQVMDAQNKFSDFVFAFHRDDTKQVDLVDTEAFVRSIIGLPYSRRSIEHMISLAKEKKANLPTFSGHSISDTEVIIAPYSLFNRLRKNRKNIQSLNQLVALCSNYRFELHPGTEVTLTSPRFADGLKATLTTKVEIVEIDNQDTHDSVDQSMDTNGEGDQSRDAEGHPVENSQDIGVDSLNLENLQI